MGVSKKSDTTENTQAHTHTLHTHTTHTHTLHTHTTHTHNTHTHYTHTHYTHTDTHTHTTSLLAVFCCAFPYNAFSCPYT